MFSPARYSRVLQRSASTWERRCAINGSRALSTSEGVWGETTTPQPVRATSVGSMSTGKPRNGRVNRLWTRFSHPDCSRSAAGRISLATDSTDIGGTRYSPVTPSMPLRKNWSSLMVVLDGLGPVPWNVFFEQEPVEKAFLSAESLDCWRPFWGIRYDLAGGRRVEPLRRLPWLNEPKVLLVICPTIFESLPAEQKATLDAFVSTGGFKVIGSKAELVAEMEELRPDLMYWLCHATPSAWF